MWRHIASNALSGFVILLFLLGGVILVGQQSYHAQGPLAQAICLKVDSGSNMGTVVNNLDAQGAVSSKRIFRIGIDYSGRGGDLKAGSFLIPAGASMADIADQITTSGRSTCGTEVVYRIGVTRAVVQVRDLDPATGRFAEVMSFNPAEGDAPEGFEQASNDTSTRFRVAVAEGSTSWQIVNALNNLAVLSGDIAGIPAEGSLAPDSYEFKKGENRDEILRRMANAQNQRIEQAWSNRADDAPVATREEMVILASIIEKETGLAEERRQVASVFANRLNRGMRLQTDPTVIYGITKGQGTLGRGLRQSELRKETPWNTYVIPGLPPTPIANPGMASLNAAVNPDETDYIFFVADGTGGHAFAATLAEHNRNVAAWRKIEAQRNNTDN